MPTGILRFGGHELRLQHRQLWRDGQLCALGGRAFDLLLVLLEHHHRVVGHDELFERVWSGLAVEPNNLQVQVWALRRLLGAGSILTVPRRGYRYVGPAPQERAAPRAGSLRWSGGPAQTAQGDGGANSASRAVRAHSAESAGSAGPLLPPGLGETTRPRLRWRAR